MFFVFDFDDHYPRGGGNDCIGIFATLAEAKAVVHNPDFNRNGWYPGRNVEIWEPRGDTIIRTWVLLSLEPHSHGWRAIVVAGTSVVAPSGQGKIVE